MLTGDAAAADGVVQVTVHIVIESWMMRVSPGQTGDEGER